MKNNFKALFACATLAVATNLLLSQEKSAPTSSLKPSTNKTTVPDFPIIGHIEKQDRTITIKSGPNGTIYSVKSTDGKVLCNNVTLDQLRAKSPGLQDFVKTAVAGNLSNGASADSRIRVTDGGAPTKADRRIP
jgi:hypothetical protein